ncbi:Vacuolar amino acid permease [Mycena indigotica]|uniref:Vacuolar amino acid permease n=1 Tax=Mycena indigotica TaxID=2126181 RepID=A0A8H6TC24_9AGAR|nr:Vacuolar amino acid permease [Mycena indigotica]KAF7314933.1 Vacuolar amino acid permease [Mycena indigotica]
MAAVPNERDPLIRKPTAQTRPVPDVEEHDAKHRLGPLEISASRRRRVLAGLWIGTFLGSLNLTLVPTMMPSISSEFQKFHQASWLGTAYLLATCTFTPLYGRLCNVMGRRAANHTAIFFAAAGTIGCGFSRNMESLIAARFLAGIGGGGLFTTSTIIVSDMYTLRNWGLIQGLASCFNGLGMGLGGPFGGVITDFLGWRAAFLLQIPLYIAAAVMTQFNVTYVTPGKSKGTKEVLKRIDYFGSLTLLTAVGSLLLFLSSRYNESLPWLDTRVIIPLSLAIAFFIAFLIVEIFVAPEPVMAPSMLRQKVPVLVSASNFLVAACNFSVTYFFPMWFQVVTLQSASTAGLHLMPNSVSMSTGSMFAGWMMHRTGRYKKINLIFGFFPFIGATLISFMRRRLWTNSVLAQYLALLAHLPESQMAVGTGFGQLFRGIGQVGGVAISSAIFQSRLDSELRKRFPPGSEDLILRIRRSSAVIRELIPEEQRLARDSYAVSLKTVYIFAACSTFLAYLVRLPIPDQDLDKAHARRRQAAEASPPAAPPQAAVDVAGPTISPSSDTLLDADSSSHSGSITPTDLDADPEANSHSRSIPTRHRRRLSGFESFDGGMDLESDVVGGSARSRASLGAART